MILKQITSEGLAHHSYYLGSGRTAAVIDPRRDCDVYLDIARGLDQQITLIFETHRNEDYVTGSRELAKRTGAGIYHGPVTAFSFGSRVEEGRSFQLGDLELSVLETPGHTLDSISLVVRDKKVSDDPYLVFTGDALFSGDAGRTDLLGRGRGEEAAGMLYDSIWNKILPLGDAVLLYPAHGAGSVCGADIVDHPVTTTGYEKKTNPLLRKDRTDFIGYKTREHHYVPPYFSRMEVVNLEGPAVMGQLPDLIPYTNRQVKELAAKGAQLLDIRAPGSFGAGYIEGSLSVWREGLAAYMGWFLHYDAPVILVDDFNLDLDPVIRQFVRLGYDNLKGYLAGGFPGWYKAGERFSRHRVWSARDLHTVIESGTEDLYLLDVRDIHNREKAGHITGDHHMYVGELPGRIQDVPENADIVVYCDAGYKGCLAASYLSIHDYPRVTNILGGFAGWSAAGLPVEK
ncbi:MAG: rhodanese-like domain-containing protein [Methanoregulaceae archaeon]|jgi:hydroxyacylglutathione hydrolase|nr:rhodanese-like domain-containing protein [Methanoregulaceae archaeon]